MRLPILTAAGVAALAMVAMPALGQRSTPKKANKFQITVVQGVEACTASTTTTGGTVNLPACDVQPSDSLCRFTTKNGKLKGKGLILAKTKDDVSVKAKLVGLNDECNGESLCAIASFRSTQDNCTSGDSCTAEDQTDFPLGVACCTVDKGKCQIKTTINESIPGAINPANNQSFIINGAGFARTGGGVPFRGGIMVELP